MNVVRDVMNQIGTPSQGISVVVPTRNRSQYIEPLLLSLDEASRNYPGPCEVILVDDSSPSEATVIKGICTRYGARLVKGTSSVRQKRNLGIEIAQYPIILFVDSDCVATPQLYVQHANTYLESAQDVAGVVGITNFVGRDSFMWQVILRTQYLNAFSFAKRMDYLPWATCSNTSYRRDVLVELHGFETNFPFRLGGDDTDLGIRVNKAGYRLKSNPQAEVNHTRATWDNFVAIWRRAFRWGRMDVYVYFRRHKDRVVFGFPKFSHVFVALGLISLAQSFLTNDFRHLLLPILWAGIVLVTMAIQTTLIARERWYFVVHELLADVLGLAFEFGSFLEGVRCGEWGVLYKTVQRGPVLSSTQQQFMFQPWAMWLGVLAVVFIQTLAIR
jgi:cellulose synthase/poly-beta-1,6-N-acetylglucosamine synthase-like glycosyltransferase